MDSTEILAKILRADRHILGNAVARLEAITGKANVLDIILKENEQLMRDHLLDLGVSPQAPAKEVYEALISKIESDDYALFKALGNLSSTDPSNCQSIGEIALKAVAPPKGFFIKKEKARELLLKTPPKKVMAFLGYDSAEAMLEKEDLFEVWSALRIIEGSEWLNTVFFPQYNTLTPDDFEEREITVKALGGKWAKEAEAFLKKKKHNISHLKELGVVFIVPAFLGISGEILRMFMLVMHYLHEIPFYADLFREAARNPDTFTANLTSLLRGDVLEHEPEDLREGKKWLVVQRYLAKEDENDWRLFVPHVNPEAVHWEGAIQDLKKVGALLDGVSDQLQFWAEIGWVGDYFKDESGVSVLVSFDLVDTVMSLVQQKEMVKYLYHHEESLWNKIFASYLGPDAPREYAKKNLLKGYFEI